MGRPQLVVLQKQRRRTRDSMSDAKGGQELIHPDMLSVAWQAGMLPTMQGLLSCSSMHADRSDAQQGQCWQVCMGQSV